MSTHEHSRQRLPLVFRRVQVEQVIDLTPNMRRIVLGGPELAGFHSAAADDHAKLFFPHPDGSLVMPVTGPEGTPVYASGAVRSPARDYTPRLHDASAGTLAVDFVLHGEGPATSWAARAQVGDTIGLGGPRGSFVVAEDFDQYALFGDETALPAIARWLEEMPAGRRVDAWIEIPDDADRQALRTQADARITWLARGGAEAGARLEAALRDVPQPPGDTFWWIACESRRARALRQHLEGDRHVPKDWIRATGYWKHAGDTGEE